MGLAAAGLAENRRTQRGVLSRAVGVMRGGSPGISLRGRRSGVTRDALRTMVVSGHLRRSERVVGLASGLSKREPIPHMNRHHGLQVRKLKGPYAVTAVCRPEQRKQRLILVDGKSLSVAERPALRGKTKTHNLDFREKRR